LKEQFWFFDMRDDFQFVYIIHEERPSVIFGGWERAGSQMCLNGIQKKSNRLFKIWILGTIFNPTDFDHFDSQLLFFDRIVRITNFFCTSILILDFPFNFFTIKARFLSLILAFNQTLMIKLWASVKIQ